MVKPVYALVGPDSFLQLEKLREILAQMPPDVQRIDIDGETAELAAVLDEVRSYAMFGGAKLVVVRNADEFVSRFREQVEDYVNQPSDSATVIFRFNSLPATQRIHKAIVKTGKIEVCEPPRPADLTRWIIQRGKSAHGLVIQPAAAELLKDFIGDDLGRLDNEIAKLALLTDNKTIEAKHVSGGVAFQREQEMKDMTIELALGNATEALRRWRQLIQLDKSAEFRAVTWLGMWLEDVGCVVNGGSTAKLSWKYKGDSLSRFTKSAQTLGKPGYARALDLLAEVDQQSKTGVGDAADNVERFILDLAAYLPKAVPASRGHSR